MRKKGPKATAEGKDCGYFDVILEDFYQFSIQKAGCFNFSISSFTQRNLFH